MTDDAARFAAPWREFTATDRCDAYTVIQLGNTLHREAIRTHGRDAEAVMRRELPELAAFVECVGRVSRPPTTPMTA